MIKLRFFIFFILFTASAGLFAQTKSELEARRKEIQKEITEINKILVSTQQKEKSLWKRLKKFNCASGR